MDFCLVKLAAVFTLFSAALCAPAALQDACAAIRNSSLELNKIAKTAADKARNQSTDLANFSNSPAWMGAKDLCDPESLKQKSAPCVWKILSVLKSYSSAVKKVSGFKCCSEISHNVKPAVDKVHKDISKCLNSFGEWKHVEESHILEEDEQSSEDWEELYLCRYTLERLYSFSILTARVFAVGNPAHHAKSAAHKCT